MARLPPLNALRAFEAGARHLSFTKAGQELNVTQAAISHQVRLLEEDLGVQLFQRLTRRLRLTDQGRALLPAVSGALAQLTEACDALRYDAFGSTLTISLPPSFGMRWLGPRLGKFWQEFPDIDLRLHHSTHNVDFARDDVDMAVRWGRGRWPGLTAEYLMDAEFTAVCSPLMLKVGPPLNSPSDLLHYPLLHDSDHEDWVQWFIAARLDPMLARRGQVIDNAVVLDQAVKAGQGAALVQLSMVSEELAAGRLIRPFTLSLEEAFAYYIVYPPAASKQPKLTAFRNFLLNEARAASEPES